ncbi:MAG: hypothetical protein RLO08_08175 [Parvibaculaceae bacterium]
MSDQHRSSRPARPAGGFASLTSDLLERRVAAPPPHSDEETEWALKETPSAPAGPAALRTRVFGKLGRPKLNAHEPGPGRRLHTNGGETGPKVYDGPERRKCNVSPVIERRQGMPARVKVSVRLEPDRHDRLKTAGILLDRTHQDLMTAALDLYLDNLNVPRTFPPR